MAKDLLRGRLAKYIPPKEEWTPVDEALYGVEDIYNVPEEKAKKLREDAIRYSFRHHYEGNKFYHEYCKGRGVGPDDIKTEEDFKKIPLVPDTFFKSYPDIEEDRGKGFLEWLENIYTGELPKIELKKRKPSYDDVIEELVKKNVYLTFSSSTSGKFSFIPRDWLSFSRARFSTKDAIRLLTPYDDLETLEPFPPKNVGVAMFMPDPSKTYLYIASLFKALINDVYKESEKVYLTDMPLTTELMSISLGRAKGIKGKIISRVMTLSRKKIMSNYIKYLKKWEKEGRTIILGGPPSTIDPLMSLMEKEGIRMRYENAVAYTGGGWKAMGKSLSSEEFKKKMKKCFGIPEKNIKDAYGMNEITALPMECEGYYKHIPCVLQPYALDEEMNPLPYGEHGRFAFLDPLANSYPGFIVTGDRVKLLEHCPVCDRHGPVLGPEIERMTGVEAKGCAGAMAKIIEEMPE